MYTSKGKYITVYFETIHRFFSFFIFLFSQFSIGAGISSVMEKSILKLKEGGE